MVAAESQPREARGLRRFGDFPVFLALRMGLQAAPAATAILLLLAIVFGVVPVALYVTVSLFAGEVAADPAHARLELWVPLIALIFFALQAGGSVLHQLNLALGRQIDAWVQRGVMLAALEPPTIGHMETAEFREAAGLARNWESAAYPPSDAVYSLVEVTKAAVVAGGSAVMLIGFSWWVPAILSIGFIMMTVWGTRLRESPSEKQATATRLRRAQYLRDRPFDPASGREARVFDLAAWFRDGSDREWRLAMEDIWRGRSGTRWAALATIAALIGSHLLVLGLIMQAGLDGHVSVTQAALYLQGAGGLVNLWLPWHVVSLREATRPFPAFEKLGRARAATTGDRGDESAPELPPDAPRANVRFRDVSFHYPGRDQPVFDGLELEIRAGASLAIVGSNGAGKTTLVKLLAGLLDPDSGAVTVDGLDIRQLRATWQHRVAAIFQDFVRYPFTVRDNVVLGEPAYDPAAVERALERAVAAEVADGLPNRLDTVLSREFDGIDLSGGQWQRIALARAMYAVERGATVLILDEPTAQLDVRAEAALFDRFLGLTAGLTTVLISHRFSSVRHADRIVVLEGGRVIEDGSHDELLARAGRYATMFRQQARHFEDPDA